MVKIDIQHLGRRGQEAIFIIKNDVGHKLYTTRAEARQALRRQRFFYKLGIAPKPGKMFRIARDLYSDYHQRTFRYGYTTEVAATGMHFPQKQRDHIEEVLLRYNIYWSDMADMNMGMINNKPVIIDFGEFFYPNDSYDLIKF